MPNLNRNLHSAKRARNDEFYTQRQDIVAEMRHYRDHFKGKAVYCNCDDPNVSEFVRYFQRNFEFLGLKRLISTCYKNQDPDLFSNHDSEQAVMLDYRGDTNKNKQVDPDEIKVTLLKGDGDFRSKESIVLLQQADIVVTNPPFSLFREYVNQLMEFDRKFIIIGAWNAVTYKEIFPLIKNNKIWMGHGFNKGNAFFRPRVPQDWEGNSVFDPRTGLVKFRNVAWFTNLDHAKRNQPLDLSFRYDIEGSEKYPRYDNYDAIEVSRTIEIPADWTGAMGVPITFLDKYCPEQFELVGMGEDNGKGHSGGIWSGHNKSVLVKGTAKFKRIFIRNRNPESG